MIPSGRAGTRASRAAGAAGRATTVVTTITVIAVITTVAIITANAVVTSKAIVVTATTAAAGGAVAGPVAGLSTPETLVIWPGTRTVAAAVWSLGKLDDHAATKETHPVAVLDGILGITGVLVLDKTIA